MRHLTPQYFNYNQLKEVATPIVSTDAANKAYVDAAVAVAGGGSGGGGSLTVLDDNNGNISLVFTPSTVTIQDDNNGNISLTFA